MEREPILTTKLSTPSGSTLFTVLKMLQITQSTSPQEISEMISKLREQKGREKETLDLIHKALTYGHSFVINLLWEQALTYQHLVMNEDAKGENVDRKVRFVNLSRMEDVIGRAKYYIVRFDLEEWKHRLYRFMGRIEDYKGNYRRAINYYRKSLRYFRTDPDYLGEHLPRYLEVEGFLSYSTIMGGHLERGYKMAQITYQKFEIDQDAKHLKQKNYLTWSIWRSGIAIRTIAALLDKKSIVSKGDLSDWLDEAEALLLPKEKFAYRLAEIKNLKERLQSN